MDNVATKRVSLMMVAVALGLAAAAPAANAQSATASCRITTYYADAAMKTKVGSVSTCPGSRAHTGRTTKFFEAEVIEYGDRPHEEGLPPDAGSLPCEYPTECANERPTPVEVTPTQMKQH